MYRIINNICPDYLKNYVSYTSDISCRDTRSTNYNQLYTAKPNCELFRIWVNTFKCLYLKWKRLNDH